MLFLSYRILALQEYIYEQLNQLKQLGLIAVLFMYTAIPGLVLLLFLALGKVVTQDPELGLLLTVCLIVAQTEISAALVNGVTNSKNRLFQRGLVGKLQRISADVLLSLTTNLVFLLCLPLLMSLGLDRWLDTAHFLFFIAIVVLSGLLATLKPAHAKSHVIGLLVISLFINTSLNYLLLATLVWQILLFVLPAGLLTNLTTSFKLGFWPSFHWYNLGQLWWRGLFITALIACANVLYVNRPDLGFFIHCFISPFVLYIATSQQLNQNECVKQYQLWLNSLGSPKPLLRSQFIAPLVLGIVGLVYLQLMTVHLMSLTVFFFALLLGVYTAYKHIKLFAIAWFAVNSAAVTINYWLYIGPWCLTS